MESQKCVAWVVAWVHGFGEPAMQIVQKGLTLYRLPAAMWCVIVVTTGHKALAATEGTCKQLARALHAGTRRPWLQVCVCVGCQGL